MLLLDLAFFLFLQKPLVPHWVGSAAALSEQGECCQGGLPAETVPGGWVKLAQNLVRNSQVLLGRLQCLTVLNPSRGHLHLSCLHVFMHPGLTSLPQFCENHFKQDLAH